MLVGLRISENRLGVQIGRRGFSLRFGGSDWAVGVQIGRRRRVQIGRWGVQIGSGRGSDWGVGVQIGAGGGSDWPRVAARVEGFRLGYGPDPIAIATFARDQESGKTHKSELNPLRPI